MGERTVNARQREVLAWIGDGCPPAVMVGSAYKTTAVALQNRRLATVAKRRGVWSATLTPAGRYFLDHGSYPDGHWHLPARAGTSQRPTAVGDTAASPRAARAASVISARPVDRLLADVVQAGDRLVVTEGSRGYWDNLVSAATRHNKVPVGKVLAVERGGNWNERVITLTDAPAWMSLHLVPVPVQDQLRRPHPAITAIRDDGVAMNVSRASRPRALRLLDALAKEACRRGYVVRTPKPGSGYSRAKGLLEIVITDTALIIDLDELHDRVPHTPTAKEIKDKERYSWTRIPTHDQVPSGRLRLRILTGAPVRQDKFTDTKTIDLAERMALVLQELELRAAAFEERRLQRAREEVARRQRWEQRIRQAKVVALDNHRAGVLLDQVARWRQCHDIDAYLGAAAGVIAGLTGEEQEQAAQWLAWAQEYRARIDPLAAAPRMPSDPTFTPEDLKPFMGGLSPYGP
jgi:hypothetical protein